MTATAATHLAELLAQIDKLKALHRAGETPTFGQVEALFDQAALFRATLPTPDPSRPAAWPTAGSPVEQAARRLVALVSAELAVALRQADAAIDSRERGR